MNECLEFMANKKRPYFVYDPFEGANKYYETAKERDDSSDAIIQSMLEDGEWCDEVDNIVIGMVSGRSVQTDRVERPRFINDDGFCDDGEDWTTDADYKCNYVIEPYEDKNSEEHF